MKCPKCGYHTLPGAADCARCAQASAGAVGQVGSGELYPPRARDRSLRADFQGGLARSAARARAAVAGPLHHVRELALPGYVGERPGFREMLRPWALSCAAVIPGFGQLLDRRPGAALTLAVAALALGGLAAVLIRHALSDALLLLLLGLCVYSVWETATSTFPPSASGDPGARVLRSLRLGLLSVGLVSAMMAGVLFSLSREYGLWTVHHDQAAPVLLPGDQFVMRSGGPLRMELRRGDIVFVRWMRTLRVVALPGERVNPMVGALQTGAPPVLSAQPQFPALPIAPATPVDVPPGWIALEQPVTRVGERPELLLLPESFIDGRVVAIYSPPARRRWFR